MSRFLDHNTVSSHYRDNILLLVRDGGILGVVTQGLCQFLRGKSLLISSKSQTEPLTTVTWIGKPFDFSQGTVRNIPGIMRKALAVVVPPAVSRLTPKRVERVTGQLQWLFGPGRGMTTFMFG